MLKKLYGQLLKDVGSRYVQGCTSGLVVNILGCVQRFFNKTQFRNLPGFAETASQAFPFLIHVTLSRIQLSGSRS